MAWSLPVLQISRGEDIHDRRYVRVHNHESEQYKTYKLIPAYADDY